MQISKFMQMIGCKTRGFSFTRALLGISANELHLCGDAAAVPLIQEMLKVADDDVKVVNFLTFNFYVCNDIRVRRCLY